MEEQCRHCVISGPKRSYAKRFAGSRRMSCASLRWTKYPSEEGEVDATLSGW
jgi:hypothetical protein